MVVHAIDGRMRIRIADIKGRPAKARAVEATLRGMRGVLTVTASPVTGSVLIHHDPRRLRQRDLLHGLRSLGYVRPTLEAWADNARGGLGAISAVADGLVEHVVRSAMELALQRAIGLLA